MKKRKFWIGIISIALLAQLTAAPVLAAPASESEKSVESDIVYEQVDGEYGWWYIEDGEVAYVDTVAQNSYGWWYVKNGKVDFSFTGLADFPNDYGWWYIENGKVDFSANTVAQNSYGWWYVINGKVDFGYTGLGNYCNDYGWWYIKSGKVDFSANTVAQNDYGWWYVTDGKVQFGYTGLGNYGNDYGWWYIKNGKVDFSANTVAQNDYGWWYVTSGKVQFGYTGVGNYCNDYGWWYIKNGQVNFSANTVAQNNYGWWYVTGGKVDFGFTGIAKNEYGWWYINGGKVDFGYNGTATVSAGTYSVESGKVKNVNASGIVSSSIIPVAEWGESDYAVSEEYIQYCGTETAQLAAPKFTGSVSDYGMTLTWNAVPGAEKYRVFRRTYGGDWQKIADTTKTTYLDNLWTEKTVYQYTVRCINSAGTAYTSPYITGYSGSALAEFGQQFVGNPYVYGGISLTDGCDCSGFVMQVYANFGYYLPHYSGNQITLGKEVSTSDAQPGDIAGRTGHVVLCIGDGKVVQAKGAAYGICITKLSDVTYSTIRRIL